MSDISSLDFTDTNTIITPIQPTEDPSSSTIIDSSVPGDIIIPSSKLILHLPDRESHPKRLKTNPPDDYYEFDRPNIIPQYITPRLGYPINDTLGLSVDDITFHTKKETKLFRPHRTSTNPVQQYKYGLQVDGLSTVKRLANPHRWCILPTSESVALEVSLAPSSNNNTVVQELGHIAWSKAVFYVDPLVYSATNVVVKAEQVLYKDYRNIPPLPRWKLRKDIALPWYLEHYKYKVTPIPSTIFCTEEYLVKRYKFIRAPKPPIIHHTTVSKQYRDSYGANIFRRYIPPRGTKYPTNPVVINRAKWDGYDNRNQWVYHSLLKFWAVEETDSSKSDRPYWQLERRVGVPRQQCYYLSNQCDGIKTNPVDLTSE